MEGPRCENPLDGGKPEGDEITMVLSAAAEALLLRLLRAHSEG